MRQMVFQTCGCLLTAAVRRSISIWPFPRAAQERLHCRNSGGARGQHDHSSLVHGCEAVIVFVVLAACCGGSVAPFALRCCTLRCVGALLIWEQSQLLLHMHSMYCCVRLNPATTATHH